MKDFEPSEHEVTAIIAYLYPNTLKLITDAVRTVPRAATPYHKIEGLRTEKIGDIYYYSGDSDPEVSQSAYTMKDVLLVDFGASWCGPCKRQAALFGLNEQNVVCEVKKMDTGKFTPAESAKYKIVRMPTLRLQYFNKSSQAWVVMKEWTGLTPVGNINAEAVKLITELNQNVAVEKSEFTNWDSF